jgi:hypothetical protein
MRGNSHTYAHLEIKVCYRVADTHTSTHTRTHAHKGPRKIAGEFRGDSKETFPEAASVFKETY